MLQSHRPSSSHSPFRSRRSHPALNHISLAPLTPRFPIDDFPDQDDYLQNSQGSYFSSSSVPSTPPILSHSRASSRPRHHRRSKSSTYALSDTNLWGLGAQHQQQVPHTGSLKQGSHTPVYGLPPEKRKSHDSEWMLRAGLALTSSTREEKGQSWLVKRESSTSLVAETESDTIRSRRTSANRHGKSTPHRSSRSSAVSTPAALSRRASRSREHSRRTSRAGFAMTAMSTEGGSSRQSRKSSVGSHLTVLPDFVDERIRAEMASIRDRDLYNDDDDESDSSSYTSGSETDGEMDEKEFQRLTRERGFGLGSWVDQFVSRTLFGVEEDLSTSPPGPTEATNRHTIVGFESAALASQSEPVEDDHDDRDDHDSESTHPVEQAGDKGGWADASWFFRLARKAIM
jgi:Protein of unknown function (DUF3984)